MIPAVLVAAWYWGFGPGILAAVSASLAAWYFCNASGNNHSVLQSQHHVTIASFFLICSALVWFIVRARRNAEAAIVTDMTDRQRAQLTLQEAEERWRSLVDSAPDYILLTDPDGKILFINHTAGGR